MFFYQCKKISITLVIGQTYFLTIKFKNVCFDNFSFLVAIEMIACCCLRIIIEFITSSGACRVQTAATTKKTRKFFIYVYCLLLYVLCFMSCVFWETFNIFAHSVLSLISHNFVFGKVLLRVMQTK